MQTMSVRCCIAGGGPAEMMLGLLLVRAGLSQRRIHNGSRRAHE
jgi:2-polyprenyl-6-methoxyphenol hydroxylase-like FAD-dependent oxidoreductase